MLLTTTVVTVLRHLQTNRDCLYAINVSWASIFRQVFDHYTSLHPVLSTTRHVAEVWAGLDEVGSSVVEDVPDKTLIARRLLPPFHPCPKTHEISRSQSHEYEYCPHVE